MRRGIDGLAAPGGTRRRPHGIRRANGPAGYAGRQQPWTKTRIGREVHSGDVDVFAAESEWRATRARWFIWENVDDKGKFERRTILEGLGAHNAVVADMDGDGDLDVANKEFAPATWNRLGGGQHADFLENRSTRRR